MADSVRESIMANVVTVLKTIDGTGDFLEDIQSQVYRYAQTFASQTIYPSIEVQEPSEEYELLEGLPARYDVRMILPVSAYVAGVGETAAGKNLSQKMSDLMQDIHRALALDETRGGFAVDTMIQNTESDVGIDTIPFGALSFNFLITYRVSYTDPTDAC